jgi:hypothetical protein
MFIGPFFYFTKGSCRDVGVIADLLTVESGSERGGKRDNDMGHPDLFERHRFDKFAEYDEVPRGRVVYDISKDEAVVYIDRCIEGHLSEVVAKFELVKYRVEHDDHYRCSGCMELEDEK